MNIPDTDPKAIMLFCAKCANPCTIAVILFPGTLVSCVCPTCMRKLYKEAEAAEESIWDDHAKLK